MYQSLTLSTKLDFKKNEFNKIVIPSISILWQTTYKTESYAFCYVLVIIFIAYLTLRFRKRTSIIPKTRDNPKTPLKPKIT